MASILSPVLRRNLILCNRTVFHGTNSFIFNTREGAYTALRGSNSAWKRSLHGSGCRQDEKDKDGSGSVIDEDADVNVESLDKAIDEMKEEFKAAAEAEKEAEAKVERAEKEARDKKIVSSLLFQKLMKALEEDFNVHEGDRAILLKKFDQFKAEDMARAGTEQSEEAGEETREEHATPFERILKLLSSDVYLTSAKMEKVHEMVKQWKVEAVEEEDEFLADASESSTRFRNLINTFAPRTKKIVKELWHPKREPKVDTMGRSFGLGRRKTSSANVWISLSDGEGGVFTINKRPMVDYFPRNIHTNLVLEPLETINKVGQFHVRCSVKGGGQTGQAGAIRLGLARALEAHEPWWREALKAAGLMKRDARRVERKKPGLVKARKAPQWVKR